MFWLRTKWVVTGMLSEDKVGFGSSQSQQPHLPVLPFLLSQGRCDVNVKNNRNQSPLHLAVIQGHVGMVQLLVSQGSDVNAEDEDGDTAMHIALERQQLMALAMEKREGEMGASLLAKVRAVPAGKGSVLSHQQLVGSEGSSSFIQSGWGAWKAALLVGKQE